MSPNSRAARRGCRFVLFAVPAALAAPGPAPAAAVVVAPTAAKDVTARHWSYEALQDLANRGLVHGYRDGKFLTGQSLTRLEVASLVRRVIENVLQIPAPGGRESRASETPGAAAARGQGVDLPPLGRPGLTAGAARVLSSLTDADLVTVRRLADEYSVELAIVGVDLQPALERVSRLEGRLAEVEQSLHHPQGPLQKAISDIARMDRIRFSGYLQSRYESFSNTRAADPADSRTAVADRFTLRRMRLTVGARPTAKIGLKWQFDGAPALVETRDAWIDYFFTGNPATGPTATLGQFKVPFGFEGPQSSGVREAPERARVIRFFYPGERDRGARIATATGGRWFAELAVYNGNIGPGHPALNLNDNNSGKNLAGRLRTTALGGTLDAGISFDFGSSLRTALAPGETARAGGAPSAANPYENTRQTLGADFQWHLAQNTELRGELVWGTASGTHATGYIGQVIHTLSRRYQVVVKYDWLGIEELVLSPVGAGGTPVGDAVPYEGTLSNLSLGLIHFLDRSTRIKLFYELHGHGRELLPYGPVPWQGNVLRFEVITNF